MPGSSRENSEKQPASAKEENLEMEKILLIEEELIEESDLEPKEWIKTYGKKFRGFIDDNPEFIKFWEENKEEAIKLWRENKEKTKSQIKEAFERIKGA